MEVGEYILIVEDDEGNVLGRLRETGRSRPPAKDDEIAISSKQTKNPRLIGTYRVRAVRLVEDQGPPVTRRRYRIPVCYLRPIQDSHEEPLDISPFDISPDMSSIAAGGDCEESVRTGNTLSALSSESAPPSIASLAQEYRNLATRLSDLADRVAEEIRSGQIDPVLPSDLHDLSRTAKQAFTRSLFTESTSRREKEPTTVSISSSTTNSLPNK